MAASSTSSPAGRRSSRGWRFSLRALLIFFTLICVGVWYWYRVPYREVVLYPKGLPLFQEEDGEVILAVREVRRFRRVLRGDPIREGSTEYFDAAGNRLHQEGWREGTLHGPFLMCHSDGKVYEQGEYDMGAKTGVWEIFDKAGSPVLQTPYDEGRRHGNAQWFEGGKVTRTVRYDRGEVTQMDGRDVDDPLGRARREGKVDDEHIAEMLDRPAAADFRETPLGEVAEYVAMTYKVNVALDKRALAEARITEDSPITLHEENLITAQLMLIMICEPKGLAATYRFGMIWITTKDNAKNWTDRTGVAELLTSPPPVGATAIQDSVRAAMARPATFDFLDTPASEIGRYLAGTYQIPLACDESLNFVPVTSSLSGISLQNALSAVCEENQFRIRWKDGKSLVLEPQK